MLREDFMPDYGLSVAGLGGRSWCVRQTINELLKGRRALSAEMALRLARLFGNSPDFWLSAQRAVDLWEAEELAGAQIERIRPLRVGDRTAEITLVRRLGLDETALAGFSNRRGILELAVFGSVLRDDYGPDSDIDILVTFVPGARVSLFDLVDMADELAGMLGRRVDLVPKQGLKPFLRESSSWRRPRSSMLRRDVLYLIDIVEAAEAIQAFLARLERPDRDGFVEDDLVRSAVLQKLSIIGEASARVSDRTRAEYPEMPWHQARGMRNLLVHAYFSVDWDLVWTTVLESVPEFRDQIARILDANGVDGLMPQEQR